MSFIFTRVIRPNVVRLGYRHLALTSIRRAEGSKEIKTEPPKAKEPPKLSKANVERGAEGGPITWKSLLMGGSILVGLTGYFVYLKNLRHEKIEREKTRTYGKAAIGGSWELVDADGKLRKSEEFSGKWQLIYFGFTHCPDVCPEELEKLAYVTDELAKMKMEIVPLFITVDPERDTPQLIKKYLSEFSDKFIGLTGTKEQVDKATRAYRVYYSAGPRDKDNDYIVDHTIISYLVNPKGELADYFGQTKEAKEVLGSILVQMKTWKG